MDVFHDGAQVHRNDPQRALTPPIVALTGQTGEKTCAAPRSTCRSRPRSPCSAACVAAARGRGRPVSGDPDAQAARGPGAALCGVHAPLPADGARRPRSQIPVASASGRPGSALGLVRYTGGSIVAAPRRRGGSGHGIRGFVDDPAALTIVADRRNNVTVCVWRRPQTCGLRVRLASAGSLLRRRTLLRSPSCDLLLLFFLRSFFAPFSPPQSRTFGVGCLWGRPLRRNGVFVWAVSPRKRGAGTRKSRLIASSVGMRLHDRVSGAHRTRPDQPWSIRRTSSSSISRPRYASITA